MQNQRKLYKLVAALLICGSWASESIHASVIPIDPFTTSTDISFTGFPDGTDVNGLTVSGASFRYMIDGLPTSDAVIIDGGPGITNNLLPPNIVSVGDNSGTLWITLATLSTRFGYGFAVLNTNVVPNATTMSVFLGATWLGSLSFTGLPDPTFSGGFAGLESNTPFDQVAITFNSEAASTFALDNLRVNNVNNTIPEPTSVLLVISALVAVGASPTG